MNSYVLVEKVRDGNAIKFVYELVDSKEAEAYRVSQIFAEVGAVCASGVFYDVQLSQKVVSELERAGFVVLPYVSGTLVKW